MAQHNANNERVKRQYRIFLKEARRQSESTIDAVTEALFRFEESTGFKDFRAFHTGQALAFKSKLASAKNARTGEQISASTLCGTLAHVKRFVQWLAGQPGYRSRLKYSDAEYFNPSEKQARIASAKREMAYPSLEQIRQTLSAMPDVSDIERRNKALIAFTALTGARDGATASLMLRHVDLVRRRVHQDARHVNTKFSKTFETFFFPVGDDILAPLTAWVDHLRSEKLWGPNDPLFPATAVTRDGQQFKAAGIARIPWRTAEPIRRIFREAFESAGLPYYHPHTFRHTLVALGEERCQTPEEFKAWSQNLGHENVLTTFTSYGAVAPRRQSELIAALSHARSKDTPDAVALAAALVTELRLRIAPSGSIVRG